MALTLKIKFEDELRRITLERLPNYNTLCEAINHMFPTLGGEFVIKYSDEDEDLITIANDIDLNESLRTVNETRMLRLTVSRKGQPFKEQPQQSNTSQPHPGTPPFGINLGNSPLAGLLSNPQLTSQLLSNPQLSQLFSSLNLNGTNNSNPNVNNNNNNNNNSNPSSIDIPSLLSSFGVNLPQEQQQNIQNLANSVLSNPQLLQFIPQLLSTLGGGNPLFPQQPQQSQQYQTESRFSCDICDNTITGVRYHCQDCADFDLCSYCREIPDIHESDHYLIEVRPSFA